MSKEAEDLKKLIREAHEAIQAFKEAKRGVEDAWRAIRQDIDDQLQAEVASAIEQMTDSVLAATELSQQKIYERFDRIIAIVLGETTYQLRSGPSIPQLLDGVPLSEDKREELTVFRKELEVDMDRIRAAQSDSPRSRLIP